jgi:dTDP-4-amino-4,6-dideoxygalactose transaminase
VNVPFVDLRRQYATIKDEIDQAIAEVVGSGRFILGPQVVALEAEMATYCGVAHAVGVGSGTDALRLALQALDIGPGDEVITSPFTFVASAETVWQVGAVPVFADIEPATYTLDPAAVARKVTARTRAIVAVHLYGHPADMAPLTELARDHGLSVVEDAAQAVGATSRGRRVGGIGHVGCFSFFPTKNLGAYGDGGLVTTDDPALADRVRMLRQHGSREKYVHALPGWCSRLDELQAAVLRVKLRHLDEWTTRRRLLANRYGSLLADLPVIPPRERAGDRSVYHLFTIRSRQRDDLLKHLSSQGIQTAVHYPTPLHLQPPYRGAQRDGFPQSERASEEVLSLPLFPELRDGELDAVVAGVTGFFGATCH